MSPNPTNKSKNESFSLNEIHFTEPAISNEEQSIHFFEMSGKELQSIMKFNSSIQLSTIKSPNETLQKLDTFYQKVLDYLNQSIACGLNCNHINDAYYWRAFILSQYIKDIQNLHSDIGLTEFIPKYWNQVKKDCQSVTQKENYNNNFSKYDILKLMGISSFYLQEYEIAKEYLLICISESQKAMEMYEDESLFDFELAELLQEIINILNEQKTNELKVLKEKLDSTTQKIVQVTSKVVSHISPSIPDDKSNSQATKVKIDISKQNNNSEIINFESQEFNEINNIKQMKSDQDIKINHIIHEEDLSQKFRFEDIEMKALSNLESIQSFILDQKIKVRQQCAFVIMNNVLFIFGGYNNNDEELNDFIAFDLPSQRWKIFPIKSDIQPSPRYAHSLIALNSLEFFTYGGRTEYGANNELWSFHPRNGWRLVSRFKPLFGHVSFVNNNTIYLFFGMSGLETHNESIIKFNLNSNKWDEVNHLKIQPPPRIYTSGALWNERDYIIFGGLGIEKKYNDIWSYSIEEQTWSSIISKCKSPPPIYNHSINIINETIIVCGAYEDNSIYTFSLLNHLWTRINLQSPNKQPIPMREGYISTIYKSTQFILFGQDEENNYPNEIYNINLKCNILNTY